MRSTKAQMAMEYMFITAIGMLIIFGFVVMVNSRVEEQNDDVSFALAEDAAHLMVLASTDVSAMGPKGKTTLAVEFPKGIKSVELTTDAEDNKYIEMIVKQGSSLQTVTYPIPSNIEIDETTSPVAGELASYEGKHVFVITAEESGYSLEDIEIELTPSKYKLYVAASQPSYVVGEKIKLT